MKNLPISLTIVFLVLGILLSTQFQSSKAAVSSLTEQSPENLAIMIKTITEKKYDLRSEKIELRSQLREFESDTIKEDEIIASIEKDINKYKAISGDLPVSGPGITITIYKSSDGWTLVHEELVAIINDLWHLKAEAIAVNDIRVTDSSRIYFDESDVNLPITIDGQRLYYPLEIKAIGDSKRMDADINVGGGNLFQLQTPPWNFKIDTEQHENIEIPAKRKVKTFNFAQPVS